MKDETPHMSRRPPFDGAPGGGSHVEHGYGQWAKG